MKEGGEDSCETLDWALCSSPKSAATHSIYLEQVSLRLCTSVSISVT